MNFEKWNSAVNLEGLKEDIEKAKENSGNGEYKEVPHGDYEVKIVKMELKESKKGDPMVTIWFEILEGEYKKSKLFMNQVITQGFQVHIVCELLRSLETGIEIEFVDYKQFNDLLLDIAEKCDTDKLEFALKYEDNKGFDKFTITEVFEA